jgi:ABC-type Mn2+/Zn2+ transport system permease subunit
VLSSGSNVENLLFGSLLAIGWRDVALAGAPLIIGAAGGLLVGAATVALAGRVPGIGRDTAVAVVVTTAFGIGVLLALSLASPPGIQNLLFGDILASSDADLLLAGALVAAVAVALRLLHWRLLAVGVDRAGARASACPPCAPTARCCS